MTKSGGSRWVRLREASPATQTLFLTLATALAYGMVGPIAYRLAAADGLLAAAAAAVACWLGAVGGIAVAFPFRARGERYVGMGFLAGMLPRMGVPLASSAALHLLGGPLAEAGVVYYALVLYLVLLGLETAMSLPTKGVRPPKPAGNRRRSHGEP